MQIKKSITAQDSENLTRYFSEIRRYEPLSKEEERKCIRDIQKHESVSALDRLCKANARFVVTVAKKYQGQGLPILDLISAGNIGMVSAARKFDLSKDFKFFSYAVWWIRIEIFTTLLRDNRSVKLPDNRALLVNRIKKEIQSLEQKLGRYPTLDELIVSTRKDPKLKDISERDISEAISYGLKPKSLQEKIGPDEDDDTLEEITRGDDGLGIDESAKAESLVIDLNTYLYQLTQYEYDILVLSSGLNGESTIRNPDLAKALSLKEKDVIKLKAKAMKHLKALKNISILRDYLQ